MKGLAVNKYSKLRTGPLPSRSSSRNRERKTMNKTVVVKPQSTPKNKKNDNRTSQPKKILQKANKSPEKYLACERQKIKQQYKSTVHRVFKRIDFFDNNFIDSSNINKWINPKVLYFFGAIFHRIKTKNIRMTGDEFMLYAQKQFYSSSIEDVKDFIQSAIPNIDNLQNAMDVMKGVQQTRGIAAVTQAACSTRRNLKLEELNYELMGKQTVTPLFSEKILQPKGIDLNVPGEATKIACQDALNFRETSPSDSKAKSIASSIDGSKENVQPDKNKLQEAKMCRLRDRLDYFIQRNSEHLHVSQYVRQQNGF